MNPDDMYYEELAERSIYFKSDEHGVSKMCEAMEKLMEEAREEERITEKKNTILRLVKEGANLRILAAAAEWPQEKVAEFLQSKNLQSAQ